jgi:thiamine biosynthesis lipoprotein
MRATENLIRLAAHAMGTRFELALWGEEDSRLRAAGQEALEEIVRLETQLSLYRQESDIADLNARAAAEPVRVEPRLFRLLQQAVTLSDLTEGAFDITIGPLLRVWGLQGAEGRRPEPAEIAAALENVGARWLELDETAFTVRFQRKGMSLDLGAIGKGYAIDCAVERLREAGIVNGLLHGGTSSVYALGHAPDRIAWQVAIARPFGMPGAPLAVVGLENRALSVSAPHGKWFQSEGRRYGHVLDPRTGYPVGRGLLAAIVSASATIGDAVSTALLTLGEPFLERLPHLCSEASALYAYQTDTRPLEIVRLGIEMTEPPGAGSAGARGE